MKKTSLFILLISSTFSFAQRNLTINEASVGNRNLMADNLVSLQWRANANEITYLSPSYQQLLSKNITTNNEEVVASLEDLQKELQKIKPEEKFNLRMFPYAYKWIETTILEFDITSDKNNYSVTYNTKSKSLEKIIGYDLNGKNATLNNNKTLVAWLNQNNINVTNNKNVTKFITNDSDNGIVNGSENTHRQEFGIDRGMWWSPTEDKLLYYRKDETMVANYPLPQWDTRVATIKNTRYPMAGEKSEEVTLVVYDLKTDKKVTLQTGEPNEQYLTTVTWDPNGSFIYVGVLNREQNHLKLNKYSALDGKFVQTLFEEKLNSWVEPQHSLLFLPNNPNQFIYQTDVEGYNQMYVYNTNGKLIKKLGFKDVIVKNTLDFSKDGSSISYIGVTNNGLDRQLFTVNLKNAKTKQLTNVSGVHNALLNNDGTYVLDQYSNTFKPNEIQVINLKNSKIETILSAKNPLEGLINMPKMEIVSITSADGKTPLNSRIIYPLNYDAAKKYPVMVYVYGGSHAQLVTNRWLGGASMFEYYMAQNGYVVYTLDNRGSDSRGRDFTRITHRNLGVAEMADQLKGIEYLKSLPFVDENKIGVYGWSYGGFMSTSLLLNHPEIFKVGVAGGPVIDWKWYEAMYGERYMDTPQENPEGYKNTSTLNKVNQLKGDLLLIHGAQDPVVVQQHSMEFIEACIKAGVQVDYFLYPTHEHNVGGKDRIHMNTKIAKYFDTHLKK